MKPSLKHCAIYTRKSTDERLDMEFNSLDAQREACLSYIASQKSEGWVPLLDEYDDGGFSGGNMDRPALARLLTDIKAGKVQTVVVYKIDRLTRSLMDFAKLVEVFDAHGVTFVSITQSFNTTTSMGRLTLNVLLSFAQFEREVAGERIRDKIAASKRKGMWMGGTVPLGYDVKDRQLVVNPEEARRVTHIYERYLELGNLNDLYQDLNRRAVPGKPRKIKGQNLPPAPFCRSSTHYLLTNPVYIGKIRHKGHVHDGQHPAIISPELWQGVQTRLSEQSATIRNQKKHNGKNLLRGLLFNSAGQPYIPTYSNKTGKQYRYYQLQEKTETQDALYRLPAHEIETKVEDAIRQKLADFNASADLLGLDSRKQPDLIQMINQRQTELAERELVHTAVKQVLVSHDSISIQVRPDKLAALITEQLHINLSPPTDTIQKIKVNYITRRAHKGAIVIESDRPNSDRDPLDLPTPALRDLVRGHIWRDDHFTGMTLREIASRDGFSEGYVGRCIACTFQFN